MEPEKTLVAHIDPAKCSSTYDLITTVDWSEQPPDIFINIAFSKTYPSQLHCFDKTTFQGLMKVQEPMANWVVKPGHTLDVVGHGGEPGTERYYKLPTGEYLLADETFKTLTKGEFSGAQYFDTVQLGTIRLGNTRPGGEAFGVSMVHGQAPGYPVFKLVLKGETKVTLKVDFSTLEKLDLQAFFKNLDEETITLWCQLASQSDSNCKKLVYLLKEKLKLQEAQILAYTILRDITRRCSDVDQVLRVNLFIDGLSTIKRLLRYLMEQDVSNIDRYKKVIDEAEADPDVTFSLYASNEPNTVKLVVSISKRVYNIKLNVVVAQQFLTFVLINDIEARLIRSRDIMCKNIKKEPLMLDAAFMKTGVHYSYKREGVTHVLDTFCSDLASGSKKCSDFFVNLLEVYRKFRLTLLAETIIWEFSYVVAEETGWSPIIIDLKVELAEKLFASHAKPESGKVLWHAFDDKVTNFFATTKKYGDEMSILVDTAEDYPVVILESPVDENAGEPFYKVTLHPTYEEAIEFLIPILLRRKQPGIRVDIDDGSGKSSDEVVQRLMSFSL
jgi:hypothetical protein